MTFEEIGNKIGKIVQQKNEAYGDSFNQSGRLVSILYPKGIGPDQMDDALAVIRIVDKLFRISSNKGAFGESPFLDIAGYGILGAERHERENFAKGKLPT